MGAGSSGPAPAPPAPPAQCKKTIDGGRYSCDELAQFTDPNEGNENNVLTCTYLEKTYCTDCSGCSCPAPKCAKACYGETCSHWIQQLGGQYQGKPLTCDRLKNDYGCDCTGCTNCR